MQAYAADNLSLPDYRERWFGRPIIKNSTCDVLHRIIVRVGLGNRQISSDLGARRVGQHVVDITESERPQQKPLRLQLDSLVQIVAHRFIAS